MAKLPDSVQQIADVIGEAAALELVRRWPRTKTNGDTPFRPVIYVPATLTPGHRLVSILGWQNALSLTKAFPGEIIFLATCAGTVRDERNEMIARLAETASPAAIAARVGLSERHVRRVMGQLQRDIPAMVHARA